ncbi:MAG: hypothetical protein GTO41_27915 [Burkholderiales bacterium]|nr:hypothetical protein [Burkholderiales bacterium]
MTDKIVDKLTYELSDGQIVTLETDDCPADMHSWLKPEHQEAMRWFLDILDHPALSHEPQAAVALEALTITAAWARAMHKRMHDLTEALESAERRCETLEWMVNDQ